jgi:hypothetical protein
MIVQWDNMTINGKTDIKGRFIAMDKCKPITTDGMEDTRELAAMLAKLPKAVRIRIFDKTDGALMVSDAQKAG